MAGQPGLWLIKIRRRWYLSDAPGHFHFLNWNKLNTIIKLITHLILSSFEVFSESLPTKETSPEKESMCDRGLG